MKNPTVCGRTRPMMQRIPSCRKGKFTHSHFDSSSTMDKPGDWPVAFMATLAHSRVPFKEVHHEHTCREFIITHSMEQRQVGRQESAASYQRTLGNSRPSGNL